MSRPESDLGSFFSALLPHLWRWGPALLWLGGILIFSARSNPLGPLSQSGHSGLIGRAAHVGEYVGLTVLLYRALARAEDRLEGIWAFVGAGLVALACATGDELFQGLVAGRDRSLSDLGWDLLGVLGGLGLSALWSLGRVSVSKAQVDT